MNKPHRHSDKWAFLTAVAIWAMLIGSALSAPAQAGYIVTLEQVGSDVVASGSGPIDLTDLRFAFFARAEGGMIPSAGNIAIGPASIEPVTAYTEFTGPGFTGPTSFGSGGTTHASSGGGDMVAIDGTDHLLFLPSGYISDSPLSDVSTYAGQTFTSLGVTPGTYEWTWGSGANQHFTLDIVAAAAAPEPSSGLLFVAALSALLLIRPRLSRQR